MPPTTRVPFLRKLHFNKLEGFGCIVIETCIRIKRALTDYKYIAMRKHAWILVLLLGLAVLDSCKKDDEEEVPTTGILRGTISDANDGTALADASIIVFDADGNSPSGSIVKSDVDGNYSTELDPGSYFIKVYKQGYQSVPPRGITAVSFEVIVGDTVSNPVEMLPSETLSAGWISGTVADAAGGVSGALVVATAGDEAYSSVTDNEGNYEIFNLPGGSFEVNAYKAAYTSSAAANATVNSQMETMGIDITMTAGAGGSVLGQVQSLSIENAEVDVALVHPITRETIPGLTAMTSAGNYTLSDVPAGTYIARASFRNDGRVMDPDNIAKFGEPVVTVNNDQIEQPFAVTGAVTLNSPTNDATTTIPLEIASTTPTFNWAAYSSTSDYVIEVIDAASGEVVWGGFSGSGDATTKNISIPSGTLSVTYNSDGNASIASLTPGKVYRWRVYASKNSQQAATGWNLISVSEDQQGLIRIAN